MRICGKNYLPPAAPVISVPSLYSSSSLTSHPTSLNHAMLNLIRWYRNERFMIWFLDKVQYGVQVDSLRLFQRRTRAQKKQVAFRWNVTSFFGENFFASSTFTNLAIFFGKFGNLYGKIGNLLWTRRMKKAPTSQRKCLISFLVIPGGFEPPLPAWEAVATNLSKSRESL